MARAAAARAEMAKRLSKLNTFVLLLLLEEGSNEK